MKNLFAWQSTTLTCRLIYVKHGDFLGCKKLMELEPLSNDNSHLGELVCGGSSLAKIPQVFSFIRTNTKNVLFCQWFLQEKSTRLARSSWCIWLGRFASDSSVISSTKSLMMVKNTSKYRGGKNPFWRISYTINVKYYFMWFSQIAIR